MKDRRRSHLTGQDIDTRSEEYRICSLEHMLHFVSSSAGTRMMLLAFGHELGEQGGTLISAALEAGWGRVMVAFWKGRLA